MGDFLRYFFRFILFILIQVFILNQVNPPLHQYVNPSLYYLFILWLPFSISRKMLMLYAFAIGFVLDSFTNTPGLHTVPCVLIAYLRPFIINVLMPQQGVEINYKEPSIKSLGFAPYAVYIVLFTLIHHFVLYLLESFHFENVFYIFIKTFLNTIISVLLILIAELLFNRKHRFITNT